MKSGDIVRFKESSGTWWKGELAIYSHTQGRYPQFVLVDPIKLGDAVGSYGAHAGFHEDYVEKP